LHLNGKQVNQIVDVALITRETLAFGHLLVLLLLKSDHSDQNGPLGSVSDGYQK